MLKRSKPSFSGRDLKSSQMYRHNNLGDHGPIISREQRDTRQVTTVPVCLQRIPSFTSGHLSYFDKSFLKVQTMNENVSTNVRCMEETKVQDVIGHVIYKFNGGQNSEQNIYSLLAVCETLNIRYWLHRDMTMSECHKELHSMHPDPDEWRFELKIRFFFTTVVDLLQTDRVAFFYLFNQVRNHLREQNAYKKLEKDVAIELVSLEIRLMLKDRIPKTPNRRVSSVSLDESEWRKHLPLCFLPSIDAKNLNKSMQKSLKSCLAVSPEECIVKYLNLISSFWRYFEESFECQIDNLISGPSVKVIVGPTVGIVYETASESVPITLARFNKIKTLETQDVGPGQLKITFHGDQPPVILRCVSKYQNKQLAYLIDGYRVLLTSTKEEDIESAYSNGEICQRSVMSQIQLGSQKEVPDYAILEENVENEIPLSVIKNSLNGPPRCTCLMTSELHSPFPPVSSTPDLISNARQSPDGDPSIISQDASCGSTSDRINLNYSSTSQCNAIVSSQSNKHSVSYKLTSEVIEEKLRLQKQQSDDDAAWLQREEARRSIGENNIKSPKKVIDRCDDDLNVSDDSISKTQSDSSDIPVERLHELKLDNSTDDLYCATVSLVKSIVDLKCAVQQGKTEILADSSKTVGVQLKTLLGVVHSEVSSLSPQTLQEAEMVQKTLRSDFGHLIDAMRMVLRYSPTELAQDYGCKVLQLGHAIAVNAKMLFDIIDISRKKISGLDQAS